MTESGERIFSLLTYIEEVEKLKAKPEFSVPTKHFSAYQHELKGLPEVRFNLQDGDDDVWLRVPRLLEISAPDVGDRLRLWVTLPKNPELLPELKTETLTDNAKGESTREALQDHPEITELFKWYVQNQWEPWAAAEGPRRKTMARYAQLFALLQGVASEGVEASLELAWGIGYAVWKKDGYATPVKHPLLVQSCEILLNEKTFDLEVRPRSVDARLEADCYAAMDVPGVHALEAFWKSTLAASASRVNPFEAYTFEGVLKAAVGHLDPSGSYEVRVDDVTPHAPNDKLKITNTWVLFARERSRDIFVVDVERLKASVAAAPDLPGVLRRFVEDGATTVKARAEQPFRGLSSSDSPAGAFELYFPMPYNDEQVSIIQKLESNDGVVVQGPPGTGKTHTIANVICHYLANGKRVLVTAKGDSALAVLQSKLPERIRPLSVALLSDERDGMKQFEHSIQTIASNVASLNPARAEASIAAADAKLNQLHAKISSVDRTVAEFAAKHMREYSFQGREVAPGDMAKLVVEQADEHQWFDDEPPATPEGLVPFDAGEISTLRQARMKVGEDLGYLGTSLPAPEAFSAWPALQGLHRDLVKARAIETCLNQGSVLELVDSQMQTFERAQSLITFVEERTALKAKLENVPRPWAQVLGARLVNMRREDQLLEVLAETCAIVQELEGARRKLLATAIVLPPEAHLSVDFCDAVTRLVGGKSAFALPFGKGEARKLIGAVKVLGSAPAAKEDWAHVQRAMDWRTNAVKALARWNSLAGEFGLEPADDGIDAAFGKVAQSRGIVEDQITLVFDFDAKLGVRLGEVFAKHAVARFANEGEAFLSLVLSSLEAHVDKGRLAYATQRVQEMLSKLEGCSGGITAELRDFLIGSVGQVSADEVVLQTTWRALQSELVRLTALRSALDEITRVGAALRSAGAPKWAKRVQTQAAAADHDGTLPATWLEAWNWRQAVMFLEGIDGHNKLRDWFAERKALTATLAQTYQDLVAEKTWLGVHNNAPESVRQALQKYLTAVRAIGKGTGSKAAMYRRDARDAMTSAYAAVPCWVMPEWRIAETLPAEIGLFDLVIIDEASQSDIWALPALMRGKKLLIVGDHKQVSPSSVGLATVQIQELRNRFLAGQPHGPYMTPERSIYDLAQVVFAGTAVMLKEHFRSVPAIIEFSNREFYEGDIKPLRLPKADERLDPPLVDVYVKGGFRKDDTNPAEAKAIVTEIESVLADEQFNGRSIGVVTLHGMAQAKLIQELVNKHISPIDIVARKISVGAPPAFQGRERDIMMVSMVQGPENRAAADRADMNQRFNVALSRARDRTYLFRSVTETTFGENTLNSRLIRHFRQPFRHDGKRVEKLRDKCESGFEREMFDELVKRGYRVQPQVPCGGFRIDFVVEGNEGRRLAVECDGDRFHGPGQWAVDMARQRVLERAGWTFWRCFASSFVRNRDAVVGDLVQTLERLGIEPLGSETVDNTVWVHSKEVDPYNTEAVAVIDVFEVTDITIATDTTPAIELEAIER